MTKKLYILEYQPDGKGCPHFIAEEGEPSEWEWESRDPNPFALIITKKYSSLIIDQEINFIDFDFYGIDSKYVSDRFVEACNVCQVRFRPVPLEIRFWNGSRPEKEYFVFLPADHLPILDPERSVSEVELILETGAPMMDRFFPNVPIYKKIEKFVAKDLDFPSVFHCVELDVLVCTDEFREHAISAKLRGLNFIPLDENYIYDPWAGW